MLVRNAFEVSDFQELWGQARSHQAFYELVSKGHYVTMKYLDLC